jgi:R3H domain
LTAVDDLDFLRERALHPFSQTPPSLYTAFQLEESRTTSQSSNLRSKPPVPCAAPAPATKPVDILATIKSASVPISPQQRLHGRRKSNRLESHRLKELISLHKLRSHDFLVDIIPPPSPSKQQASFLILNQIEGHFEEDFNLVPADIKADRPPPPLSRHARTILKQIEPQLLRHFEDIILEYLQTCAGKSAIIESLNKYHRFIVHSICSYHQVESFSQERQADNLLVKDVYLRVAAVTASSPLRQQTLFETLYQEKQPAQQRHPDLDSFSALTLVVTPSS